MKCVVLIGLDPATVDFSDPALPPGMTAEKIWELAEKADQFFYLGKGYTRAEFAALMEYEMRAANPTQIS